MVSINKGYIFSLQGILRIVVHLFFVALIIAAALIKNIFATDLNYILKQARDALLFYSVAGFVISAIIIVLYVFDIVKSTGGAYKFLKIFEIAFDILWGLSLFALGIACAVRESQLKTEFYYARDTYNNGAFGACAFFCFASAIGMAVLAAVNVLEFFKGKK